MGNDLCSTRMARTSALARTSSMATALSAPSALSAPLDGSRRVSAMSLTAAASMLMNALKRSTTATTTPLASTTRALSSASATRTVQVMSGGALAQATMATPGCAACTKCRMGFHEIEPCTSTTDRTCEINVADGLYMIESEADDNRMCVAMMNGEWFPSRMNWGNGDEYCGIAGETPEEKRTELLADGQAIFKLTHVGKNNDQEDRRFQDQYLIEFNDGEGYRCLFFGDKGKDIYPSLQNCHSFDIADQGNCPWNNGAKGLDYCGFAKDGMEPLDALLQNGQAIWRLTPLKLNEDKYIMQSASKGKQDQDGSPIWECLAFEEQGAATNPSRYNWGNGDSWCGAGDWGGLGKEYALMNNKQAVFILTFMQAVEEVNIGVEGA